MGKRIYITNLTNKNMMNFGVGLKYRVLYSDGTTCDFKFIGGKDPMVEIILGGESVETTSLNSVVKNYTFVIEIE